MKIRNCLRAILLVVLAAVSLSSIAEAQVFECVRRDDGGVDLFASSEHDRVLRCEVKCSYWKPDGQEGYQKCNTQLAPNQPRRKMCGWNMNDAKAIVGESHDCQ